MIPENLNKTKNTLKKEITEQEEKARAEQLEAKKMMAVQQFNDNYKTFNELRSKIDAAVEPFYKARSLRNTRLRTSSMRGDELSFKKAFGQEGTFSLDHDVDSFVRAINSLEDDEVFIVNMNAPSMPSSPFTERMLQKCRTKGDPTGSRFCGASIAWNVDDVYFKWYHDIDGMPAGPWRIDEDTDAIVPSRTGPKCIHFIDKHHPLPTTFDELEDASTGTREKFLDDVITCYNPATIQALHHAANVIGKHAKLVYKSEQNALFKELKPIMKEAGILMRDNKHAMQKTRDAITDYRVMKQDLDGDIKLLEDMNIMKHDEHSVASHISMINDMKLTVTVPEPEPGVSSWFAIGDWSRPSWPAFTSDKTMHFEFVGEARPLSKRAWSAFNKGGSRDAMLRCLHSDVVGMDTIPKSKTDADLFVACNQPDMLDWLEKETGARMNLIRVMRRKMEGALQDKMKTMETVADAVSTEVKELLSRS